jgi:triacylglycerol lipase
MNEIKNDSIIKFAKISEITYKNPKKSIQEFKDLGFVIVKFFDAGGAQAYLLKEECVANYVLSFRGTEVTERSDIVADMKAGKNIETQAGGKVHSGFRSELNKIWSDIEKSVADIEKLDVTGHSLGAAMATIAASRIQSKVQTLVTFGSPRVGDKHFVSSLNVCHYRVQNNCDSVTKVPPRLMGFRHHGTHVYINFDGQFKNFNPWQRVKDMIHSRITGWKTGERFLGVKDHLMANYIKQLQRPKDNTPAG